jgi:hypothetical protein
MDQRGRRLVLMMEVPLIFALPPFLTALFILSPLFSTYCFPVPGPIHRHCEISPAGGLISCLCYSS